VLMEFKALEEGDDLNEALLEGAVQIRERHYATELLATGASVVYEYTMAFDGKTAWVKRVEDVLKA
jgi:PD-(D/E)XK nuclease superfamily